LGDRRIKTSFHYISVPTGNLRILQSDSKTAGFTLIELMVVMLLISIILAVAIPRFEGAFLQDPTKKISRWMINTVRTLRSTALQRQKLQTLVVDLNDNRMWIIQEDMDEDARAAASEKSFRMPSAVRIVDVVFPEREQISSGNAEIHFYPSGFSDAAVIHLETGNTERFSFLVEPLLPKVKFFEEWISF
jgi:prepilin-type N-terminal cleavage/methylation domain-containing protein